MSDHCLRVYIFIVWYNELLSHTLETDSVYAMAGHGHRPACMHEQPLRLPHLISSLMLLRHLKLR